MVLISGIYSFLLWPSHSFHYKWEEEQNGARNELSSCAKLITAGSFLAMLFSPALACLYPLAIFLIYGRSAFPRSAPDISLIVSWGCIIFFAFGSLVIVAPRRKTHEQRTPSSEGYTLLQERTEDGDTHEESDEADGPTFLPQQPFPAHHDIFGGPLSKETEATSVSTSCVSWEGAVGPSETLRELVHWAISAPGESLPPHVTPEVLATAAISIGVCPDGMESWDPE